MTQHMAYSGIDAARCRFLFLSHLKLYYCGALLALLVGPAAAQQDSTNGTAPGVNPKDNITKTEVIGSFNSFEGNLDTTTLAFKFDYAFDTAWGMNIEAPFTRFSSPGSRASGFGDIAFRVRNVRTDGAISVISALELKAPTASDDLLGSGQWQVNPVIGAVYAFDQLNFAFLGYKHFLSVAEDEDRAPINSSEIRVLFARLSRNGRWAIGDIKYTRSHESDELETIDLEIEGGSMITDSIGLSGRLGSSYLDSTRELSLSVNLRKIW